MTQRLTPAGTANPPSILLEDASITLNLIASETGHEAAQTLNYLRFLVQKAQSSQLAPELTGFALPEIERLERLVQHLRQFKLPPLQLAGVALAAPLEQTLSTLNETGSKVAVTWAIEVPSHLSVHTDASYLARALHCLASHALGNALLGTVVTIRAAVTDWNRGEEISVEVVDCGPPQPDPSPRALFDVWTLHTPDSQPARRAIAHRLLRHLGSTLTYEHTGGSNVFRFTLPRARGTV